jgi:hypothetical protein
MKVDNNLARPNVRANYGSAFAPIIARLRIGNAGSHDSLARSPAARAFLEHPASRTVDRTACVPALLTRHKVNTSCIGWAEVPQFFPSADSVHCLMTVNQAFLPQGMKATARSQTQRLEALDSLTFEGICVDPALQRKKRRGRPYRNTAVHSREDHTPDLIDVQVNIWNHCHFSKPFAPGGESTGTLQLHILQRCDPAARKRCMPFPTINLGCWFTA